YHLFLFFFFQAEDGIRDFHVTGVQTCALPICVTEDQLLRAADFNHLIEISRAQKLVFSNTIFLHWTRKKTEFDPLDLLATPNERSEERRVGKEGRCREWQRQDERKGRGREGAM